MKDYEPMELIGFHKADFFMEDYTPPILIGFSKTAHQKLRTLNQILAWAFGMARHNDIDDECCPDFSCCNPEMFETDSQKRWDRYAEEKRRMEE